MWVSQPPWQTPIPIIIYEHMVPSSSSFSYSHLLSIGICYQKQHKLLDRSCHLLCHQDRSRRRELAHSSAWNSTREKQHLGLRRHERAYLHHATHQGQQDHSVSPAPARPVLGNICGSGTSLCPYKALRIHSITYPEQSEMPWSLLQGKRKTR